MQAFRTHAALLAAALGSFLAAEAHAADRDAKDSPRPGFSGSVFAGAAYLPDFEGSRTSHAGPVLGAELSYRTQDRGVFGLGSQGLSWSLESGDSSLGIALGADGGRSDSKENGLGSSGLRQGSERLKGLGRIGGTATVSVFGATKLGPVPVHAGITHATGSHKGTEASLGATLLSWSPTERLTLSVSPGLTWADSRYMQAYFGVTDAQASRSGYRTFKAGAGVKSLQVGTGVEFEIDKRWALAGGVQVKRLVGDAADSPITEKKVQTGAMLSLQYRF